MSGEITDPIDALLANAVTCADRLKDSDHEAAHLLLFLVGLVEGFRVRTRERIMQHADDTIGLMNQLADAQQQLKAQREGTDN